MHQSFIVGAYIQLVKSSMHKPHPILSTPPRPPSSWIGMYDFLAYKKLYVTFRIRQFLLFVIPTLIEGKKIIAADRTFWW